MDVYLQYTKDLIMKIKLFSYGTFSKDSCCDSKMSCVCVRVRARACVHVGDARKERVCFVCKVTLRWNSYSASG